MTGPVDLVEIVVEWVAGDPQRYEWDERAGVVRPVEDGRTPPEHYGCVPGAAAADGELLDVFLLHDGTPRRPGDPVRARLVGVLRRSDGDHKLLAVDPAQCTFTQVTEIDAERLRAMWRWIRRQQTVMGWWGPAEAHELLAAARRDWRGRHG